MHSTVGEYTSELDLAVSWQAGECRVHASGALAEHTASLLEAVLDHVDRAGARRVHVDLSDARLAGPDGLALLLRLGRRTANTRDDGAETASPALRRLFRRLARPGVVTSGFRYALPSSI